MIQNKHPVLWSLSNRSGSLFQQPLLAALNLEGEASAVCSPHSPARPVYESSGKLLMAPPVVTGTASIAGFVGGAIRARRRLAQRISAEASVVHVTMSSPIDAFYIAATRKTDSPVILTVHDNIRHLGEKSSLLDAVDRRIRRDVDHLVTVSQFVYEELRRQNHGMPVHFVPNGLLTRDVPGLAPRAAISGPPRILFLGRIHEYKGLALLLQALELLDSSGLATRLTIAGSGDLTPYAEAMARRDDITVINDWIDDATVLQLLRDHDILALPYLEASQSGVAIDAQWAAMPAVATPVGALPEQFSDGVDALICNDVSAQAFADSLTDLVSDESLYSRLSAGAHAAYRKKDLDVVALRWRDFYESLLVAKG
jgi:glycosyltransferase involved in cell wall biosynthesis